MPLVQLHAHGHFLLDWRCPGAFVKLPSLTAARGYPCRREALSIVYGCPLRPRSSPLRRHISGGKFELHRQ
jgi:hypothetical protein